MPDWSQLIDDFGPLVWRTAYRILNHHDDAADCFQATFVAAWRLTGRERVDHWPAVLRRLATARALEMLRSRIRRRRRNEALPAGVADRTAFEPQESFAAQELQERLLAVLSELPAVQAEIVCLVSLEGMSNTEVASALGMTANHVGVQLHRAREVLKRRLAAGACAIEQKSIP